MPRITGLKPSKRRSGWCDLHLDGAFRFRLPLRLADRDGLAVDCELSDAEVASLQAEAESREALDRALRYLSYRPRSRFEVERHLRSRGYGDPAVVSTLDRCARQGYIDDREFAAAFARDRIRLRPRAPVLIELELRRRGVRSEHARAGIDQALADERVSEPELALRAARRGFNSLGAPGTRDEETVRRRLYGYLDRRGFRREEAAAALEEVLREAASDFE
jgi:regulatory protein